MLTKQFLKFENALPTKKLDVFGNHINIGNFRGILQQVLNLAKDNKSSYVCFANVHMLYESDREKAFKSVLNTADIVCPDGKPVSMLMQSISGQKQERVCGMDFLPELLKLAAESDLRVFFYGSTENVLTSIKTKINSELPNLKIAGTYSPPFRPLSPQEDEEVINLINNSGAHIVLVSLGCPKQEKWMHNHRGKINACMLGVGQAFNTYSGLEKRLPLPIRNLGLEWMYRLYLEPSRLWKRYLFSNTWFLIQCIKTVA